MCACKRKIRTKSSDFSVLERRSSGLSKGLRNTTLTPVSYEFLGLEITKPPSDTVYTIGEKLVFEYIDYYTYYWDGISFIFK
jgi:hypothetical protein